MILPFSLQSSTLLVIRILVLEQNDYKTTYQSDAPTYENELVAAIVYQSIWCWKKLFRCKYQNCITPFELHQRT